MNKITNESNYHNTDKEDRVDQLWQEFELYEQNVNEGPVGDAAKGFAKSLGGVAAAGAKKAGSAALGAVKKGASAAKKEISQKVTVRKLNSMWKKMGSPTDTGSIAKLLSDAGMSDEQIGTVAQQNQVELPAPQKSQDSDQAAQGTDQQGSGTATQGTDQQNSGASTTGAKVDVKSLAAEIKKLPATEVKAIKDELTAEVGKLTASDQQSDTAQNTQQPPATDKPQPSDKPTSKKKTKKKVTKKKVTKKTQPQQPTQ